LVRQRHELQAREQSQTVSEPEIGLRELRAVLDEELLRLPEKYRLPLLLCCAEGATRDEAAQRLGWSVGAVKGYLERGRDLLRTRLARRGVPLSVALLAVLLEQNVAPAAVPALMTVSTVKAGVQFAAGTAAHNAIAPQALTLAEGVLRT